MEMEEGWSPEARALFGFLTSEEVVWLEVNEPFKERFYEIAVMSDKELREELEAEGCVELCESTIGFNSQGKIDNVPYINVYGAFTEEIPDWIRASNFSVGHFPLDYEEFILCCRRILLRRLRLHIWESIIRVRKDRKERREAASAPANQYGCYL